MTRNPLLVPNSSTAALTKAETTLVAELPAVLGKTSIPVGGKSMTPQQIVAIFQRHLDAMAALTKQRAQTTAAVQTERADRATAQAAVPYIRNYVAAAFGESSAQYASLGFAPRKPAQKTVESKAQAHRQDARHAQGSPDDGQAAEGEDPWRRARARARERWERCCCRFAVAFAVARDTDWWWPWRRRVERHEQRLALTARTDLQAR